MIEGGGAFICFRRDRRRTPGGHGRGLPLYKPLRRCCYIRGHSLTQYSLGPDRIWYYTEGFGWNRVYFSGTRIAMLKRGSFGQRLSRDRIRLGGLHSSTTRQETLNCPFRYFIFHPFLFLGHCVCCALGCPF